MTRARKKTRNVNLRSAYTMSGYTSGYAWFIREKVIPVIGIKSLRPLRSSAGSKEREWSCTTRNFQRIVKAYDLKPLVQKIDESDIVRLLASVVQPTEPKVSDEWPAAFKIPVHPISNNLQYKAVRGRMVSTDMHLRYKKIFSELINKLSPNISNVDWNKPVEVKMHFGHREASDAGYPFDRNNFQKAAIDELFRYIGRDDSLVHTTSMSGEFVNDYSEGFIEYKIRNL